MPDVQHNLVLTHVQCYRSHGDQALVRVCCHVRMKWNSTHQHESASILLSCDGNHLVNTGMVEVAKGEIICQIIGSLSNNGSAYSAVFIFKHTLNNNISKKYFSCFAFIYSFKNWRLRLGISRANCASLLLRA